MSMRVIKHLYFILLLFTQSAYAQTPDFIFVFLNRKMDKTELPEEEVKKIMERNKKIGNNKLPIYMVKST